MNRFKIKMSVVDMKMMAMMAAHVAKSIVPVVSIDDLVTVDVMEKIWSRMRNMYRPDKDKYTVQFNSIETKFIQNTLVPAMMSTDDPFMQSFGSRVHQCLYNQINRECSNYNTMNYGG